MSIISQTTWEKFTQEEKKEIRGLYSDLINVMKLEVIGTQRHIMLSAMQDRYISLFGKEQLQPKPLTYEDAARELSIGDFNGINSKLDALLNLLVVAKYLNQGWKPDWKNFDEFKHCFSIRDGIELSTTYVQSMNYAPVYFRTEELARQAIEILGEDVIRLALGDY